MTRGPSKAGPRLLSAAILDVDGVLLASPHERAWREALVGFTDPERLTPALYQAEVAGKSRLEGAFAALVVLGVPQADRQAPVYATRKQARLEALIRCGKVAAYPDALRFVRGLKAMGVPMALASSSKNATAMMQSIRFDRGDSFLEVFDADLSGRDVARGKPDPEIFLAAAKALRVRPDRCLVVEDAPAGIRAARAGGMTALGVARRGDGEGLSVAGADLVVDSLDEIDLDALHAGRLQSRAG